jgi:hypothetical protein
MVVNFKSEIKMGLLHEQGVKADDQLESAHRRQAAHDGAKQALRQIAKNISGMAALVDRDMDDGKIPLDEPVKAASYVKLMIDRAVNAAMSAAQHQENLQLSVGGEISAYQGMVDAIKKEILTEQSKAQALEQAIASGQVVVEDDSPSLADDAPGRGRPTGVRPGGGLAAQRRAEEAAEASTAVVMDAGALESMASAKPNGKRGSKRKTD